MRKITDEIAAFVVNPPIERPAQRARTRKKIERAARKLFVNGGYLTCSVADIVSAAGLSRAVFYLHFRDKCDLLEAVIRKSIAVQQRSLTRASVPLDPSDADLEQWVLRYIDGIERSMESVRLMNLGSFVDPQFGAISYRSQNEGLMELARRNSAFGVLDKSGRIQTDRFAEFNLIFYELGAVALAIAYRSWSADRNVAVGLIVARLRRFIDQGNPQRG